MSEIKDTELVHESDFVRFMGCGFQEDGTCVAVLLDSYNENLCTQSPLLITQETLRSRERNLIYRDVVPDVTWHATHVLRKTSEGNKKPSWKTHTLENIRSRAYVEHRK